MHLIDLSPVLAQMDTMYFGCFIQKNASELETHILLAASLLLLTLGYVSVSIGDMGSSDEKR